MSLNGLDDPKVQEAHEAAVAEPGGWFLLKYASRDEVELLGRGSGGVVEVRNNVAEYEETSPLYGFLRYRRRNVIIKYLPEDCSRLIQARVAVHFNAVCDRFSPYDTIFEITEAKELKDTKLSAACSLHAASGSNSSSSSSLRRRRLMEIAEEEEEEQQQRATKRQSVAENDEDGDIRPKTAKTSHDPTEPVTLNSELAESPEQSKFTDASTSEVPNFVGVDDRPASPSQSEAQPRMSSQSGRPDLYSYSSYNYGKPKVKLGPRPSLDTNGRPRTAGAYRPVSQMPSGFKLFGKGSKKEKNREGAATTEDTAVEDKDAVTEQGGLQIVHTELTRPATSSGVSIPGSPVLPVPPPAKPTISPEKARLMKAMKLREKKKKNMAAEAADAPSPPLEFPGPSEEDSATDRVEDHETQLETESDHPSISNADSGIGLDASSASMNTDQASDLAHTDSHPDSPVIASSEPEISTKASSLSESTDETLHPKNDDILDQEKDEEIEDVEASDSHANGELVAAEDVTPVIDALPSKDEETVENTTPEPLPEADTNIPAPQTEVSANSSEPTADRTPDKLETTEVSENISKADEPLSPTIDTSKILKSKFSTQDLKTEPLPNSPNRSTRENSPIIVTEQDEDEGKNEEETVLPETKQQKRKTNIEPIKTDFAEDKDRLSDDEDLMEELHSATLHEAKPMTVAKSPVTPVFPSPTKGQRSPTIVRTVSNPVHGKLLAPGDVTTSSARSVSSGGAAYLHKVAQQPNGPSLTRKSTVGSSISQRIKALEKLSASTGEKNLSPAPTPSSRERPSSAFFSVRRSREPSRSPSIADRASSFNRQNLRTPPSRSGSRDESPDRARKSHRERSNSVASRLSMFEAHVPESDGSPESISVTARIVRDPSQNTAKSLEPPKDPSEFNPLELKESPLLVDHQKASPVWTPAALEHPKETILERRMSKEGSRSESKSRDKEDHSRRSSLSVVKDFINDRRKSLTSPSSDAAGAKGSQSPTRPPSTHQGKRLSISSRRSSISRDRDNVLSPTATTESSASGDETKSNSEKKKSRAGRFMRRLSSLSSSRGKTTPPTILSPTVQEEMVEPVRPATTAGPPSIVSYMGDVNVQFPDNLLWKRRNMCLDSQGFLILSALPAQSSRTAQGTKRYHMSDFRSPYIPDVEVQELPNSVVLDLVDGSSVQLACMDRAGQMGILDILQEAHARHATSFCL
ncbi:hypothetical protein IL306_005529 [Fusarium sp. DS 682]|nr:hypothetical protein IL306_005529 [Fusarium sp. DS 682]